MKKFLRKALVLLLSAVMILSLASCAKTPAVHPEREERMDLSDGFFLAGGKDELTKISENGRFILYANLRFGEVAVEDKENGKTWYSNPVDKRDDGLASGFYKNSLLSVITVVYETDQSVEMTCGGYMSSVTKDGLSYRIEPDGSIVFMFDFVKEMIRVPVRFSLEDDCFLASIITDWVAEYGPNRIKKIDLLPFFGAGNSATEGYMLVPDGSGSLIYYNNGRLEASTFEKPLYGFDNGTSDRVLGGAAASGSITLSENACLPVFGVRQDTQGFLAVIGGGRARAAINANVAGKYTNYNTVWSEYSYRTYGTVRQIQKDGSDLAVTVAEKTLETFEDYEVRYYFLPEGASDYADMAGLYRDLLIRDGLLKPRVSEGDIPLYADLYGYLKKTKSFLGMPVQASITTGSVNDASLFVDRLSEAGLRNLVVKYNYWSKG
ncbi:MAG: hypothetical protein J6Y95_05755, partial [Lachnospiraceae bacterium]|nr:hypothetical protein [Lachnospiraceae bacterium]